MPGIPLEQHAFLAGKAIVAENGIKIGHTVDRVIGGDQGTASPLQIIDDLFRLVRRIIILRRIDQQACRILRHILRKKIQIFHFNIIFGNSLQKGFIQRSLTVAVQHIQNRNIFIGHIVDGAGHLTFSIIGRMH